ncbi:MAG: hypothetical protein WBN96_14005 [Gammaproteobacteria bacterium]
MKNIILGTAAIFTIIFSMTGKAEGIGMGVHAGTLGYGIDLTYGITESINIRGQYNTIGLDDDDTDGGLTYNYDLDWNTYGILVDWHPFSGGFRVSAGYFINNNELTGIASGTDVEVGNNTYAGPVGLKSAITFDSSAPYLGVGWGNAAEHNSKLSFMFEIGALLQGSPKISLVETSAAPTVSQADLNAEAAQVEADISEFDVYPVVTLGLAYQF